MDHERRCRAAVASTFLAGLELARGGTGTIDQLTEWQDVIIPLLTRIERRGSMALPGV